MEKKKTDENQSWATVMCFGPCLILGFASDALSDVGSMQILYSGILGGIGALMGITAFALTKNSGRGFKILATIALILISGAAVFSLAAKPSETEILEQEWITQKIGKIEFDSPVKLVQFPSEIPESVK